jgi:hypothetical protein
LPPPTLPLSHWYLSLPFFYLSPSFTATLDITVIRGSEDEREIKNLNLVLSVFGLPKKKKRKEGEDNWDLQRRSKGKGQVLE